MNQNNQFKLHALLSAVSSTRLLALQFAEDSVGHLQEWQELRPRLLRVLGTRSLEGTIRQIMSEDVPGKGDANEQV